MCQIIALEPPRQYAAGDTLLLQAFLCESGSSIFNMDPLAYEKWRMKKVLEYKAAMEIPEEQPLDSEHIADCRAWIIGDELA